MDVLKEKQITVRATKRPVEYNYTNADIHHEDTTAAEGYQFEYPVNWSADQSQHKVIGIRRINYKPTSIDLAFTITLLDSMFDNTNIDVTFIFTAENTFEEIITRIVTYINDELSKTDKKYLMLSHLHQYFLQSISAIY